MNKTFKITYTDPITGDMRITTETFKDTPKALVEIPGQEPTTVNISAKEWAEDYAYMLADKGSYKIEEMTK